MASLISFFVRGMLIGTFGVAFASKARSRDDVAQFTAATRKLMPWRRIPASPVSLFLLASEGATAAMLVIPATVQAGYVVAIALLLVFALVMARAIVGGEVAVCNCFGSSYTTISWSHVFRNATLLVFAGVGLVAESVLSGGQLRFASLLAAGVGLVVGFVLTRWDDLVFLVSAKDNPTLASPRSAR